MRANVSRGTRYRVDDDVLDGNIVKAAVREHREHLAADVIVAADGAREDLRQPLPEAVRVVRRGMAPEHSVVLGQQVQPAARPGDTHHLGHRFRCVGNRLQDVAADHEVELVGFERQCEGRRRECGHRWKGRSR